LRLNPLFENVPVLIKGAGDLASGVAYRLKRVGFPLVMTELAKPLLVRRTVSYGEAVYSGETIVEGIVARLVDNPAEARRLATSRDIPILIDSENTAAKALRPKIVVDAVMAKVNTGTGVTDAPLVIGLGPGFTAGLDCHVVIETNRGHRLGRVIQIGPAETNTGTPGLVKGYGTDRVLRAPAAGRVTGLISIGDRVSQGQLIATVNSHELFAPFDGVLRGLIHPDVAVTAGLKIGDLDPRGQVEHCFTISDKSLAIAGGVVEAILTSDIIRPDRSSLT
jgi:xanthine dehydrogenase accessory factor